MAKKCKISSIRKANDEYRQKYNNNNKLPKEVRKRQKQVQREIKRR